MTTGVAVPRHNTGGQRAGTSGHSGTEQASGRGWSVCICVCDGGEIIIHYLHPYVHIFIYCQLHAHNT